MTSFGVIVIDFTKNIFCSRSGSTQSFSGSLRNIIVFASLILGNCLDCVDSRIEVELLVEVDDLVGATLLCSDLAFIAPHPLPDEVQKLPVVVRSDCFENDKTVIFNYQTM